MEDTRTIISYAQTTEIQTNLEVVVFDIIREDLLPFEVNFVPYDASKISFENIEFPEENCLIFIDSNIYNFDDALEFIKRKNNQGQKCQTVIINSNDTNLFHAALHHNQGNLLMQEHITSNIILAIINRLLGDYFFGFEPFFMDDFPLFDRSYSIFGDVNTEKLADNYFQDFLEHLPESERNSFRSYITELFYNAISYAVMKISPEERDSDKFISIPSKITISHQDRITIRIVEDQEKYGISVIDGYGSLESSRVLQKIRRHTTLSDESHAPGVGDLTGRGFYILSRKNRLVINVLKDQMTEIILMHFYKENQNKYQPLIINERI